MAESVDADAPAPDGLGRLFEREVAAALAEAGDELDLVLEHLTLRRHRDSGAFAVGHGDHRVAVLHEVEGRVFRRGARFGVVPGDAEDAADREVGVGFVLNGHDGLLGRGKDKRHEGPPERRWKKSSREI